MLHTGRGETFQLPLGRKWLEWFEITESWWRKIEGILFSIDADYNLKPARHDAHVVFGLKHDWSATSIRLHAHGCGSEYSFSRRVCQLKNDRHARRSRRLPPHGEPIKQTATHFFTGAVESSGTNPTFAEVTTQRQVWSPVDGSYVLNCPTYAISVRPEDSAA